MKAEVLPFALRDEAGAATQTLAVTSTAQTMTVVGGWSMRFVNSGTQTVFFRMMYSAGNVATVASSCPLLANTVETFNVPQGVVGISFIAAGTGSTIYVTPGESA